MTHLRSTSIGLFLALLSPAGLHAQDAGNVPVPQPNACAAALAEGPRQVEARIRALDDVISIPDRLLALSAYERLAADPDVGALLPSQPLFKLLGDPDMYYYPSVLKLAFERAVRTPRNGVPPVQHVLMAIREALRGLVPAQSIEGRIGALRQGQPDAIKRIAGDMTLEEEQILLHGGDHLHPTPESLIGQYVAETGAATLPRSFPLGPGYEGLGPEKLVVAVSQESFPAFMRIFSRHDLMGVIGHAYVFHSGKLSSYIHKYAEFRLPSPGGILPMILLKTTEAQRLTLYFRAYSSPDFQNAENVLFQPWRLNGYCAANGWGGCTQWIGNLPIGDELVDAYAMASGFDGDENTARIQPLRPFEYPQDPLIGRIWKVPGHKQLADVLGERNANLRGELSNPGWVIQTLIGRTSPARVPVVFYFTQDHRAPIPPDFTPVFEAPR